MDLGIISGDVTEIIRQLKSKERAEIIVHKDTLKPEVLAGNARYMNYSITIDGAPNEANQVNLVIKRMIASS